MVCFRYLTWSVSFFLLRLSIWGGGTQLSRNDMRKKVKPNCRLKKIFFLSRLNFFCRGIRSDNRQNNLWIILLLQFPIHQSLSERFCQSWNKQDSPRRRESNMLMFSFLCFLFCFSDDHHFMFKFFLLSQHHPTDSPNLAHMLGVAAVDVSERTLTKVNGNAVKSYTKEYRAEKHQTEISMGNTVKSLFSAVLNLAPSSNYRRSSKHGWN